MWAICYTACLYQKVPDTKSFSGHGFTTKIIIHEYLPQVSQEELQSRIIRI